MSAASLWCHERTSENFEIYGTHYRIVGPRCHVGAPTVPILDSMNVVLTLHCGTCFNIVRAFRIRHDPQITNEECPI